MTESSPPPDKLDYELLRELEGQEFTNQRVLADRLGVSVGKVNYCLKAVVERGWVKVNNFRRADNKLAYAYLLTPSGMRAKMHLTRAFLARKDLEFEQLQHEIAALRHQVSEEDAADSKR
jgi:MarR family transcriptional regulator, temperature-dependent positive regulator of motility